MSRLVIVSNRLPVTIDKKEGELFYHPSAGGLATGLSSLEGEVDKIWIGWVGQEIESPEEQQKARTLLADQDLIPIFLDESEISCYYEGFSNKIVWPHFHYFTQYVNYDDSYWSSYQAVNQRFAEVVINELQEGDLVWIHDYQLMLLPAMIRKAFPGISIGFFLHIPFPSYEIFRTLPWREAILDGLLGADQIGFHTYGYMRHFLSAVYRISGYDHSFGKLTVNGRLINVDVFPMGIDYNKYAFPEQVTDLGQSNRIVERLKAKGRKLIISIDRLDYTKGIPQRLRAFEQFIAQYPEYRGKVTLMMIVVPSRSNVDQYQELKAEVDTLVGRIDGQFRTFGWSPIQYFYRSFSFSDICALYQVADIAMITPLRDGMNLVAKEFVASKERSQQGVLILSEMAGASNELNDALIVNPQDQMDLIQAIHQAMSMPPEEQAQRLRKMQAQLKKYTVKHWAQTFIQEQGKMSQSKQNNKANTLTNFHQQALTQAYQTAPRRLILLDYDGTLMNFFPNPAQAIPDQKLLELLRQLNSPEGTKVVLISGRDHHTMEEWLGPLNLEMAAEHGVWFKKNNRWKLSMGLSKQWKSNVRPILEGLVERTPGSFIEEKDYSLAWHYRMIDKGLGAKRIREFKDVLRYLIANLNLQVLEGNKVLEVKNSEINKGQVAQLWLNEADWDFVLA
ncbi:MAG: bifunctional alpha,alpha-trehalose-phosphate synthase (UDP-forming)/trehalose-phosphatase, partial [Bacteroidota bacterium]